MASRDEDEAEVEPIAADEDDGAAEVDPEAPADIAEEGAEEEAPPAVPDPFYGFEEEEEPNLGSKDMGAVLAYWERQNTTPGYDPVPALRRLAEIFEQEMAIYMRKDPDPFDERHPYRSDPKGQFGVLLKTLFRKDMFMNKLVNDYLRDNYFTRQNVQKSALELNILACRVILIIMPGLETSAVFQVEFDNLINRIYSWAEDSIEPLQSYATGLLAAAMEVNEIAVAFRDLNTRLVPKMLKRLHMLQAIYKSVSMQGTSMGRAEPSPLTTQLLNVDTPQHGEECSPMSLGGFEDSIPHASTPANVLSKFIKKTYIPIHPPTAETSQMLILRYLTSMGEFQEFLGYAIEQNALQLIFNYIEKLDQRDTCLAFEALKYLASLLCHKKFAMEFIARGGLELLMEVPRPSIAATGVSIALYYLAVCEDAMERIAMMPKTMIATLVSYALWMLGWSYDSGKCHATMFFGLSFQFKVILDEFDAQDGLRKLYNVIAVLKILNPTANDSDMEELNDEVENASRQLVRHVCVALKRYMESHLCYKYNTYMRAHFPTTNITKAAKASMEQISEQIRNLQENTSVRAHWKPVEDLLNLGVISLLLKVIALSYEWNSGGRSETVRSALDVLSICCVIPKVYAAYCEQLDLPHEVTSGIYSILGAAAGDITADSEVQKSALAVLCHCVCAPTARREPNGIIKWASVGGSGGGGSASRRAKHNHKYSEELVEKVWESVCSNNGIIVLLSLMQIKAPITDADCIRGMACQALAGLARSERVRQIVGKLPLFASGQIQTLMRDPILQEKRAEHVLFQKYALELLERISGKTKSINNQFDASLSNMHKANVIAQTKIQYNEQQLLQLIHDHLTAKGMEQTAQMLRREAGLQTPTVAATKCLHQSPYDYKVMPTSATSRNRLRSRMQDVTQAMNAASGEGGTDPAGNAPHTPIKLVRKVDRNALSPAINPATGPQRSLEKQISSVADDETLTKSDFLPPHGGGITLATIVTEYLTNQHALCDNPMTTCPTFDLLTPHKCPDPKPNRVHDVANLNIAARQFMAQSGYDTMRMDRRFVHSNFASWRTIRYNEQNDVQFSCCDFIASSNVLLVGTHTGDAKAFNVTNGSEICSSICHSYLIDSIKSNRRGDLILTSSSWRAPLSVLSTVHETEFSSRMRFNNEYYCEFSHGVQDRVLGTQNNSAVIYDITTEKAISTFTPTIANQYTKNRATFCPTDELILSDGVLFDVRSGKQLHKFDKLNQTLSGVFHPSGLEIISNTEVWDLRTFHLLQTVPVLDQCFVKFSPLNVLYAQSLDYENRLDFDDSTTYETSFKVLDFCDYSSITTIDVKRNIHDLCVNGNGSLIALVENHTGYESKQETFVKIYAVGMKKNEDLEDEEEEETDDGGGSDNSDLFEEDEPQILFNSGRRQRSFGEFFARTVERSQRNGNVDVDADVDLDGFEDIDDDEDDDDDSDDDDDDDGWINIESSEDDHEVPRGRNRNRGRIARGRRNYHRPPPRPDADHPME